MGKKINIRPTSGVYATYKRLSYQPWTAIAEFVDNSTQSFYDHKDELMAQKYAKGLKITIDYIEDAEHGDRIEIYDDAYGMEWFDFQRAVVLDRPPKNTNGRNEFGMGLKTAACWFGSLWSVESTQLGSKNKYYTEINVDEVGKYKTEEIDVREETVSLKEHYTKIVIKNLNKKIRGARTVGKVKELLTSIYREDLRSGLVKIYYNGTMLQFKEAPVYTETVGGVSKQWKKEVDFTIEHEGKLLTVRGFIALRLPGSVKDAGFTLLRRGRVIVGGSDSNYRPSEIFGDSKTFTSQRLYGELHMDNWPVTQAKDNFDWHNGGLEEKFIEILKELTPEYRRKAESIRVRETIDAGTLAKTAMEGLTNSGIFENVNVQIVENVPANNTVSSTEENSSESGEINQDGSLSDTTIQEDDLPEEVAITDEDDGVAIQGGNQIDYTFTCHGIEYTFHIVLDMTDPSAHWLLVEGNGDAEFTLYINMRHAFFKPLIEKRDFLPIMIRMSIAIVLAEIESVLMSPDGRIDPCDIRLKMNEILENVRKGTPTNE